MHMHCTVARYLFGIHNTNTQSFFAQQTGDENVLMLRLIWIECCTRYYLAAQRHTGPAHPDAAYITLRLHALEQEKKQHERNWQGGVRR